MKDMSLLYLRNKHLMIAYFNLIESYPEAKPRGEIYREAGEMVYLSECRARQLISKLIKNKAFVADVQRERNSEG